MLVPGEYLAVHDRHEYIAEFIQHQFLRRINRIGIGQFECNFSKGEVPRIVIADSIVGQDEPEVSFVIPDQLVDRVIWNRAGIVLIVTKGEIPGPIESLEAIVRGDPDESVTVLEHGIDLVG